MAKIINFQKVQNMLNDDLIVELFEIIEGMKNPPKEFRGIPEVEDVVKMGGRLEKAVKNAIFENAVEEVPA